MHMADALISPATGAVMWAATAATTLHSAKRVRELDEPSRVPLMGVAGAFVFAAQMVNFTIPGTGSSGHLGGGLLLAVLLGPEAAFLVMASILTVQALFFADGGLLALGANIFNLGFFPAFVAYPIFRALAGVSPSRRRLFASALPAALLAVVAGSVGVAAQTAASGVAELPFTAFVSVLVPIHIAIGLVEGAVTAAVVSFVREAQPEVLGDGAHATGGSVSRRAVTALAIAALLTAGAVSWLASENPDGLEWSIARVAGTDMVGDGSALESDLATIQRRTAVLPDYRLPAAGEGAGGGGSEAGTSVAGTVGGLVTLLLVAGVGALLGVRARRTRR